MTKKQKLTNNLRFLVFFVFSIVFLFPALMAFADNQLVANYPPLRVVVSDDLSQGSAGPTPNINVRLTFWIENTNYSGQAVTCNSNGEQMYSIVKQYSGSSYTYRDPRQTSAFTYDFNSGNTGQVNKYQGIFFCNTGFISGESGAIDNRLSQLKAQGKMFESPLYQKTTVQTVASSNPQIIFSPTTNNGYFESGTRVVITAENLPANLGLAKCTDNPNNPNYRMSVVLNGQSTRFYCLPYPFVVKSDAIEGNINMTGGNNTLRVIINNSQGELIAQNSIGFIVGTPPNNVSSTNPNGSQTPGQGSANDKLINPLPTDNLLATFLNIAKGFLAGIAIWAVIFIIVGGFRMVVAAGNEEAITVAKKTITWAILGLVIALLSFSIVAIVQNLLNVNVKDLNPGTINPSSYIQSKNIKT